MMDSEHTLPESYYDFEDMSWPWDLGEYAPIASLACCDVTFLNIHPETVVYKYQSRVRKQAKQRLKNAIVDIKVTSTHQVKKINVWIQREPKAADLFDYHVGRIPFSARDIVHKEQLSNGQTNMYSIDLDSVYYDNPTSKRPVYKLAKTDMLNRNRFQLVVQLVFLDQSKSNEFVSPAFHCRTQPKSGLEIDGTEIQPARDECKSASLDSPTYDEPTSAVHKLLVAEEAVIGKLDVEVFTQRGDKRDIAYHFPMKQVFPQKLEEGDVVGLIGDKRSHNGPSLIMLTPENFDSVLQVGVVSRSAFFEGNLPTNKSVITEKICILGIVAVKVIGAVKAGERVYACNKCPGKAIGESHPWRTNKRQRLLGMALETSTNNSMQLVKCFVSFFAGATNDFLYREETEVYKRTELMVEKSVKRKMNRIACLIGGYFLSFAILIVLYLLIIFPPEYSKKN